ncbi:MAG: TlpA family protein disulfide reductase [Chlorobiales bacterium]|nr:TlpA family protein disulfide reductase [Chlorobiales bacterium]
MGSKGKQSSQAVTPKESATYGQAIKKELKSWAIIGGVFLVLFLTGLHRPLISGLQQVVLWTGLMKPEINLPAEEQLPADYHFDLVTLDGKPVSLADFKGKPVFMNFWATWCTPCIAEMPNIHSLYTKIDPDKIAFVMVSLDDDPNTAAKFIEQKGYTFPVYRISGGRPQAYSSQTIPTTYIISPNGKIVAKRQGLASYDTDEFREFLNGLTNE